MKQPVNIYLKMSFTSKIIVRQTHRQANKHTVYRQPTDCSILPQVAGKSDHLELERTTIQVGVAVGVIMLYDDCYCFAVVVICLLYTSDAADE